MKNSFVPNVLWSLFSGRWLTSDRLNKYPCIFVFFYLLSIIIILITANGNIDRIGRPLGTDFCSFYAAGHLAYEGKPYKAYDIKSHYSAEKSAVGSDKIDYYGFFYPPTYIFFFLPLAILPYSFALCIWVFLTLVFFLLMIKLLSGQNQAILFSLAFPATFLTILHGQNAFLTAGLIAGMIYYLDRRPILAGILIGMLTFKPHLGVLFPLAFIITRRWRVFAAASVTALIFLLFSILVFGIETWQAYLNNTSFIVQVLDEGIVPFYKMQSLYSGLRNMGAAVSFSYFFHSLLAITITFGVIWIWGHPTDIYLKAAALCTGCLLIPPFLLDYDLLILGISITCLAIYGLNHNPISGLTGFLAISWFVPIIFRPLNIFAPFPWSALFLSLFFLKIFSMARENYLTN